MFDYTITYLLGQVNPTDALSRRPDLCVEQEVKEMVLILEEQVRRIKVRVNGKIVSPWKIINMMHGDLMDKL